VQASPAITLLLTDERAQGIIGVRRPIVQRHVRRWWHRMTMTRLRKALVARRRTPLRQRRSARNVFPWLRALQCRVTRLHSNDAVAIQQGLATWLDRYLIPLARELSLLEQAMHQLLQRCARRGLFDQVNAKGRLQRPPNLPAVLADVRAVCERTNVTTRRVDALVEKGLCRDKKTAERVVEEVRQAEDVAAGIARGIVLAYGEYGDLGLLRSSSFPYTDELLILSKQAFHLGALTPDHTALLHILVADLLAVADAIEAVLPKRWNTRLLTDPAHSPIRQALRNALGDVRRGRLLAHIAHERGCSPDEALQLSVALLEHGLDGLIDWRAGHGAGTTRERLQRVRVRKALLAHFAALHGEDYHAIATLLDHLQDAQEETGVALPLATLINSYPSSWRRRRIARRIWFSLARTMQRKQRGRRRVPRLRRSKVVAEQVKQEGVQIDALVAAFARRANLDVADARDRLRLLITYGPLALLPRGQWATCIDSRLLSWLRLIKWGRLEGRVPWLDVLHQVNDYRRELGMEGTLSSQLTKAIFNSLPKPRYWHAGQGERTARVRQRATAATGATLLLHDVWLVIPLEVSLPLCDALGKRIGEQLWVLLVVDKATELPLGAWVSAHEPGAAEIGLSIYEAIWHPGDRAWPLHGTPRTIQIPKDLVSVSSTTQTDGTAADPLADLRRAAPYLLATIDTAQRRPQQGLKQVRALVGDIEMAFPTEVQKRLQGHEYTVSRLLQELHIWLRQRCFGGHISAAVWESVRKHGVVMPGHDTPAAGWLLPRVAAPLETVVDGVLVDGRCYRSSFFHCAPDRLLFGRAFPFRYPLDEPEQLAPGVFVEVGEQHHSQLFFLTMP
jgi:hypothetical protein